MRLVVLLSVVLSARIVNVRSKVSRTSDIGMGGNMGLNPPIGKHYAPMYFVVMPTLVKYAGADYHRWIYVAIILTQRKKAALMAQEIL